jgi:putative ABC transport system permease protein
MEFLLRQLHYAGRQALKNPGVTSTTLLVLALGIGGTTAVLSLISEVLLAPPPHAAPQRLFEVKDDVSVPNGLDLQAQASTVEQITLLDIGGDFSLTDVTQPRNLFGAEVTTNFLGTLGVRPSIGRDFVGDEGMPGQHDVVILTAALWRRTFGGDPQIAGRLIRLNDRPVRVVGVTPPDFRFGDVEIFRPLLVESYRDKRGRHDNMAILRVKPQVTGAQAEANLKAIAQQLALQYPQENTGFKIQLKPLDDPRANRAQGPLSMLLTASLFVLLIVGVNVANLLLARGIARRREFALRTVLGSSAGRLVGQVVIECTLLFVAGGALGILLAYWSRGILATLAAPYFGPQFEPRLDWRVAACSMGLAVTAGMLCALAPALQARRARLQDVLKSSTQSVVGSTSRVLNNALVITEIALAFILLVGTGLMLRSLAQIATLPHGFETAEAVITSTKLPSMQYRAPEQQIAYVTQLLDAAKGLPGVKAAGVTTDAPLRGAGSMWFLVEGRPRPQKGQELAGRALAVSPDYFKTFGIPLRRGRGIELLDVKNAPPVVVISETLARKHFPGEDPLGQRIRDAGVLADDLPGLRAGTARRRHARLTRAGGAAGVRWRSPPHRAP